MKRSEAIEIVEQWAMGLTDGDVFEKFVSLVVDMWESGDIEIDEEDGPYRSASGDRL